MEFHAVILCGKGKALMPFSEGRTTGIPKALLPVANKPVIEYVLEWCEKAFFPKITVVCSNESAEAIKEAVEGYKKMSKSVLGSGEELTTNAKEDKGFSLNIEVLAVDAETTGEVFYYLYEREVFKPFSQFVLLPCDFITNLPPQVLIEAYRNKAYSDIGTLFGYRNQLDIEDRKSQIFPKNYTIYKDLPDGKGVFLDYYTNEDVHFHGALKIRTQMCWRYPSAVISSRILNSSIFFGSVEAISSLLRKEEIDEHYFKHRPLIKLIRDIARRSWRHSKELETIGFCVLPYQATFCRVNNTPALMEANRYMIKKGNSVSLQQQQQQHNLQQKDKTSAQVGTDSLVGENTHLGEKTNVKRTIIGSNCDIGKRVKLTGCLILNNVQINDDVQLENCIIGNGVVIHSKARMVSCNVESTYEVVKNKQAKGETLMCLSINDVTEDAAEFAVSSGEESQSSFDDDSEDSLGSFEDERGDNTDGLFAY